VKKYNVYYDTPEGPVQSSGEEIIKEKFAQYRNELLAELDQKIFTAETEREKMLYRIFFSVVESELTNYKEL
jgi:hypothetical protein